MNNGIEKIQQHMQTTFEGQVNGRTFNDREAMNQYIGKCISEGTPITNLSFSSTSHYNEPDRQLTPTQDARVPRRNCSAINRAQNEISWVTYLNGINQRVPKPYDNVINYVVPFVHEDINIDTSNMVDILEDFKNRLNERMKFLEFLVFSKIRTWKYDEGQVHNWLELLASSLMYKLEWANNRVNVIEDFMNNGDEFILGHIDDSALRCFHDIYTETAGYCSALIDIINDLMKDLNAGTDNK